MLHLPLRLASYPGWDSDIDGQAAKAAVAAGLLLAEELQLDITRLTYIDQARVAALRIGVHHYLRENASC